MRALEEPPMETTLYVLALFQLTGSPQFPVRERATSALCKLCVEKDIRPFIKLAKKSPIPEVVRRAALVERAYRTVLKPGETMPFFHFLHANPSNNLGRVEDSVIHFEVLFERGADRRDMLELLRIARARQASYFIWRIPAWGLP